MTVIASDIDGVLADIETPLSKKIAAHFNISIEEASKDKWEMSERYILPKHEVREFLNSEECFGSEDFWYSAIPIMDNILALESAQNRNHQIVLVTGRHNNVRDITMQWLIDHELWPDYLLMDTKDVKHKAIKYAGSNFLIEDKFSEALIIAKKGFTCYLVRREYNIQFEVDQLPENLIFIDDVQEALEKENL